MIPQNQCCSAKTKHFVAIIRGLPDNQRNATLQCMAKLPCNHGQLINENAGTVMIGLFCFETNNSWIK
jgi:hypothetical protein